MAFFEQQMDTGLSYGAKGGPVFSTAKRYTQGGQRIVNKNWTYPLHRYDLQFAIKTQQDFEEVINLFYVVSGSFDGFRLKDWADYKSDGRGVVVLTGGVYQMFKTYTKGSRTFSRKISKPVAGAQVFRTRSGSTSNITGTDASVNTTNGVVTITGHVSGDTYTWTGEFDVPVAFMSDEFMPIIENRTDNDEFLINSGPIMLEEIRL